MTILNVVVLLLLFTAKALPQQPPTVYEYYTEGGIQSGLTYNGTEFILNGKQIRIYCGAMHYFRVHSEQWKDRLKRIRASGCNTVETYVPWNLHEISRNQFDFGNGNNDMSILLNVRRFIEMAQEEDLLVIFRPGPYICGEWEFGGLPSWLQSTPNMRVRTQYPPYLARVQNFFDALLPQVVDLQFIHGGPMIMFQLGAFDDIQPGYLEFIQDCMERNGILGPFFTSDHVSSNTDKGALAGVLHGANQGSGDVELGLSTLKQLRPGMPLIVPEYWTGGFTHWFSTWHSTGPSAEELNTGLDIILNQFNASVNFYVFIGGTNFGFLNGANGHWNGTHWGDSTYGADVTNYDYGAPLKEWGDYTEKYHRIRETLLQSQIVEFFTPEMPPENEKTAFPSVSVQKYLNYAAFLDQIPTKIQSDVLLSMEELPINGGGGQSFGYILYRKHLDVLDTTGGMNIRTTRVHDFGMLIINGEVQQENDYVVSPMSANWTLPENPTKENATVDILIENLGRVNFGHAASFLQQKGLPDGKIWFNDEEQTNFTIVPLEFKSEWISGLTGWADYNSTEAIKGPVILESTFQLNSTPNDTFIDMSAFNKGILFVNGFNIGRYFKAGPQQTLYAPGPLFRIGENKITIFEMIEAASEIIFTTQPQLGPTGKEVK